MYKGKLVMIKAPFEVKGAFCFIWKIYFSWLLVAASDVNKSLESRKRSGIYGLTGAIKT
jgi:hypothetical protein